MAFATGPRIRIVYGNEVTHGTIPANLNVKQLRCITRDINQEAHSLGSKEAYPDRQRRDFRLGMREVKASFGYELSLAQQSAGVITNWGMDDVLQGILGSSGWSATGSAPATPGTIKVGTTLNTVAIERQFLDIAQYEAYPGCVWDSITIDFKPESIIGGVITVVGMGPVVTSTSSIQGTGTLTTPTTAPPLDVFLGQITEGGTTIGYATSASITIKNGRTLTGVIGSKISPDVFEGTCLVNGTVDVLFQDQSLLTKFLNETPSSLVLNATELGGVPATGRRMVFTLPVIKYSKGDKMPKSEGPVTLGLPFEALYDTVSSTTIQIDRYL